MHSENFLDLVRTESKANSHLVKRCWSKRPRFCIKCGNKKVYKIANNRYRCANNACSYSFGDFTNRWLGKRNITARHWLWLIKLFDLEVSARRATKEVNLSYPTVLEAMRLIRLAIATRAPDFLDLCHETVLDDELFGVKRIGEAEHIARSRVPIFGIYQPDDKIRVRVITTTHAEGAQDFLDGKPGAQNCFALVDYGQFRGCEALLLVGYKSQQPKQELISTHYLSDCQEKMNPLTAFWSFTREHLNRYHGITAQSVVLYMKEMEFRYNHRDQMLFSLIVDCLCQLVPSPKWYMQDSSNFKSYSRTNEGIAETDTDLVFEEGW